MKEQQRIRRERKALRIFLYRSAPGGGRRIPAVRSS